MTFGCLVLDEEKHHPASGADEPTGSELEHVKVAVRDVQEGSIQREIQARAPLINATHGRTVGRTVRVDLGGDFWSNLKAIHRRRIRLDNRRPRRSNVDLGGEEDEEEDEDEEDEEEDDGSEEY